MIINILQIHIVSGNWDDSVFMKKIDKFVGKKDFNLSQSQAIIGNNITINNYGINNT